jgi:gliding motility-associated lipoprotein GldH
MTSSYSCTRVEQYFHEFPGEVWDFRDSASFSVDINQPGTYAFSILLRQNDQYPYSNIWIKTEIRNPDNKKIRNEFPLTLADNDGNWLGQGPGNNIDNRFLVIPNLKLEKPGKYTFILKQDMRNNKLEGVKEVGIRLKRIALAL